MQHQQRRALARKLEEQAYWLETVSTNQLRAVLDNLATLVADIEQVVAIETRESE